MRILSLDNLIVRLVVETKFFEVLNAHMKQIHVYVWLQIQDRNTCTNTTL